MKMYNKKSLISVFLLSILLMGVSCKKQLDVNQIQMYLPYPRVMLTWFSQQLYLPL